MNNGYEMHTSERIRNLGKNPKPVKKLVGMRVTLLCLVLSVGVYTFARTQVADTTQEPILEAIRQGMSQQNPILLVIAGALLLLCILVIILIKAVKGKR